MGVVSNSWFYRVLLSIVYMFKALALTDVQTPSLGPPYVVPLRILTRPDSAPGSSVRGHLSASREKTNFGIQPVSITRFPLTRFSPGAGLLRYVFFIGSG